MKQPLHEYLDNYINTNPVPYHTPGHKGKLENTNILSPNKILSADIPDDICSFPGRITDSENEISRFYNTFHSFFLVNGSTSGIHAMFPACFRPGDKVLLGRNIHSSAVSAMVHTGAIPEYVPIELSTGGMPLNIDIDCFKNKLKDESYRGIFITTPSYHGVHLNILPVTDIAQKNNVKILVDEAWGAHFPFSSKLPGSNLSEKTHMVVHGLHKTLPVLTGGAVLHVNSRNIELHRVEACLGMSQTTSPNMLVYLSIENGVNYFINNGKKLIDNVIERLAGLKETFNRKDFGFQAIVSVPAGFSLDPMKLILKTDYCRTGVSGYEYSEKLIKKYGIIPEMADLDTVLLIFTGFETENSWDILKKALFSVSESFEIKTGNKQPSYSQPGLPVLAMPPREAFFADSELIKLSNAKGRIAKSLIVPYPPGVPLLVPGEVITKDVVEYQKKLIELGGVVRGIIPEQGELYLEVVK